MSRTPSREVCRPGSVNHLNPYPAIHSAAGHAMFPFREHSQTMDLRRQVELIRQMSKFVWTPTPSGSTNVRSLASWIARSIPSPWDGIDQDERRTRDAADSSERSCVDSMSWSSTPARSHMVAHRHSFLAFKPGITELWQVSGRSDVGYDQRVKLHVYYAEHWSAGLDLSILARTVKTVVARKGAY